MIALPFLAACEDAVTDPDEVMVASEAAAVLRSAADLPTLPGIITETLADSAGLPDSARYTLHSADELWARAAVENDLVRAARWRSRAVSMAAPYLAVQLDSARLGDLRQQLREWIEMASGMLKHFRLPEVEQALDDAAAQLARSEVAEVRGQHETAVWLALSAQSRLVDTTPRVVARRMSDMATARYRADTSRGVTFDERTRQRVERLVSGAREALDRQDYLRAIQRAYYANQLLEMR
ncbi:MAG: hypothetical protein P8174_10760 [Gemmatimonadota bacterium]